MIAETSPELRLRILWLAIGYLLIAVVMYLSLTSNPIDTGLQIQYLDKIFHALAYLSLMTWFAQIYHGKFQRILIALAFIAMGCVIEFLQSFDVNRYAEFADMVANFSGVILGFVITQTKAKNTLVKMEHIIL